MESSDRPTPAVVAALEHLTGASRGTLSWIVGDDVDILLTPSRRLVISDGKIDPSLGQKIAHIRLREGGYALEVTDGNQVWVNAAPVTECQLRQSDVIEFRNDGPMVRLRLFREGAHPRHMVSDILADTASYLRMSRQPPPLRLVRAARTLARRLMFETTLLFRSMIVAAIVALAVFSYQQERERSRLEEELESGVARIDSFAAALVRARDEALKPVDLRELREELAQRIGTAARRLEKLEKLSRASTDVIARSSGAVAFLQGGYGFRDHESGRMLRHVVDPDTGRSLFNPMGLPLLTLDGDGPIAERHFTGTGFKLAGRRLIATNRHVALPWEEDAASQSLRGRGMEPVMLRLIGYFPGFAAPLPLELVAPSEEADLALLTFSAADDPGLPDGLGLLDSVPQAGTEVIVMGYPTGLRSLLAQTGARFIETLEAEGVTDFWTVAERLAATGHIAPLSSRGIVGQATGVTIVYDADTTHGGSGGPVLDTEGRVVAVNTAILPEYGGSNLGMPARLLRELIGPETRD